MITAKATAVVLNHHYRDRHRHPVPVPSTRSPGLFSPPTATPVLIPAKKKKAYRIILCSASSIKRYTPVRYVRSSSSFSSFFISSLFFFFWCCKEGVGYDYEKFDRVLRVVSLGIFSTPAPILVADDLRSQLNKAYYGKKFMHKPHLDRFTDTASVFDWVYTNHASCTFR